MRVFDVTMDFESLGGEFMVTKTDLAKQMANARLYG
jgi:hypothetical protein